MSGNEQSCYTNAGRDKFITLLNLLGLAIGITATIMIFVYIQDQVTYDRHNPDPPGPTLKDEYPEIVEQTRILP